MCVFAVGKEKMAQVFKKVEEKVDSLMNPAADVKYPIKPQRNMGLPPPPRPPVGGPTADELHLQSQSERAKQVQELSEGIHTGLDDLKGEGKQPLTRAKGLWSVVRGFAHRSYIEAKSSASRSIRDSATNRDIHAFVRDFRSIAEAGAVFISSHHCDVIHDGKSCPGVMHVCSTHLCFIGHGLIHAIPLKNICSILPSVSLPTTKGPPMLVALPSDRVKSTALQVLTVPTTEDGGSNPVYDNYQFLDFAATVLHQVADATVPLTNVMKCYVALDRAWRAETKVPVEGVRYSEST